MHPLEEINRNTKQDNENVFESSLGTTKSAFPKRHPGEEHCTGEPRQPQNSANLGHELCQEWEVKRWVKGHK